MASKICTFCGLRLSAIGRSSIACGSLFLALALFAPIPVLADGCFVFRWNKKTDINEPTQKAIILHDAGQENLLLQVKYEGPLEEFGWLIPVPALPKVEKGSMEAFYELSQLTQRQFAMNYAGATLGGRSSKSGLDDSVKVVEVKTVGAYEVAVLSAQDAGSLSRWLRAHDYSIPEGKAGIVDEYIRKGWYFIAAKIELNRGAAFKMVSSASPKDIAAPAKARNVIQTQLSKGELHPLLISFDTPHCIFPLKISAVGGKPSKVSVYVLSTEPLLNAFIFDKGIGKLNQRRAEWQRTAKDREEMRKKSMQNMRSLRLAWEMYSLMPPIEKGQKRVREWSPEDLEAIGNEGQPSMPQEPTDDDYYASPHELLQCMQVTPDKIPQCAKQMPRLKTKSWYLTKQIWTFPPDEMDDLEFQPAIPILAGVLKSPEGGTAAGILTQLGDRALPILLSAIQSANSIERINASLFLQSLQGQHLVEPLLILLKDDVPQVRFHAVIGTDANWDPRFIDPLIGLFRDRHPRIRWQAAQWLCLHESTNRSPIYVELLKDPNPDVQACALKVLSRIGQDSAPRAEWLRLLAIPRLEIVSQALSLLQGPSSDWPAQPATMDLRSQARKDQLSSAEAAPLTTNQLTLARLVGLKILTRNSDAEAVALTLPLLRDTNSIVRSRAFVLLRTVTSQDIPQNDPAKWDQWWAANRGTFIPKKPDR